MFLDEVASLIATVPSLNSDGSEWTGFEERMGIVVPHAYKQFVSAYGPGMLDGSIRFHHPTVPLGRETLVDEVEGLEDAWQRYEMFREENPFPVGRKPGALVAWGSTSSGIGVAFRLAADPEKSTIVEHADGEFSDTGLSFADWLLRYLHGGGSGFILPRSEKGMSGPIEYT